MVPEFEYLWIFSIYGYSFTIFIITTALNVLPIDWLKWVFLGVSGGVSLMFIVVEMYTYLKTELGQNFCKFILICLLLGLSHGIFVLALK